MLIFSHDQKTCEWLTLVCPHNLSQHCCWVWSGLFLMWGVMKWHSLELIPPFSGICTSVFYRQSTNPPLIILGLIYLTFTQSYYLHGSYSYYLISMWLSSLCCFISLVSFSGLFLVCALPLGICTLLSYLTVAIFEQRNDPGDRKKHLFLPLKPSLMDVDSSRELAQRVRLHWYKSSTGPL